MLVLLILILCAYTNAVQSSLHSQNRMLLHRSVDRSRETELSQKDVEYVYATCHDPMRPPLSLIPGCASKGIPEVAGSWLSTGYGPQTLHIALSVRWLVRRVSFRSEGVKQATLSIDSVGRYSTSQRLGDENFFVFDLTGSFILPQLPFPRAQT